MRGFLHCLLHSHLRWTLAGGRQMLRSLAFLFVANMASRGKSICRHAGCGKLIDVSGYCEQHAKLHQQQSDAQRGTAHQRGYNRRWQKARITYLSRHPLCKHCEGAGIVVAATVVDHIIAHKGDQDLFWQTDNWQPLCKPCHDKKTAREDGGFGR